MEREREREVQFGIVVYFELLLAPSGGVCDVELKRNEKQKWICKNRRKLGFQREREREREFDRFDRSKPSFSMNTIATLQPRRENAASGSSLLRWALRSDLGFLVMALGSILYMRVRKSSVL